MRTVTASAPPPSGDRRRAWLLLLLLAATGLLAYRVRDPAYGELVASLIATPDAGTAPPRESPGPGCLLRLGEASPVPGFVDLPPARPIDLDFMTRDEIFGIRSAAVARHSELIAPGYRPSVGVFGGIVSERPWWGLRGQFFDGPGEHSIDGPSEESRFLVNPYLLLAADLWTRSPDPWRRERFSEDELSRPDFPYECAPATLRWWPRARFAQASYLVSRYAAAMERIGGTSFPIRGLMFDVVAYNARDLGLGFAMLLPDRCDNVRQSSPATTPFSIIHYIHLGGSCGYPGGCNNMSPRDPNLDAFELEDLPARATFGLWQEEPASADTPADLTFSLQFE